MALPVLGVHYSFLSMSIWLLIDTVVSGHPYVHPLIPYWNSGVRLGLFLIATQFLTLLKSQSHIEQNLSRTDGLTGVMNGRGFAEAAERMFELAARHGRPTTLAYIDLDDFKQVNDRHGHGEGDKVLQTVGETLLERCVKLTWQVAWAAMNLPSRCPKPMKPAHKSSSAKSEAILPW